VDDISQLYQICADTERFTRAKRDQKQARKITSQTIKARDDHEDLSIHIVDNHSLHALRRPSGGWKSLGSSLFWIAFCSRYPFCAVDIPVVIKERDVFMNGTGWMPVSFVSVLSLIVKASRFWTGCFGMGCRKSHILRAFWRLRELRALLLTMFVPLVCCLGWLFFTFALYPPALRMNSRRTVATIE
jgi:hypothetical protein